MDVVQTILAIITALSGGGILGVFIERKKRKAETRSVEADVFSKMEEQYKKYIEHTKIQFEELKRENDVLRKRINELEAQLKLLKK